MRLSLRGIVISERWFNRLVIGAVALGFLALVAAGVAATLVIEQNQRHTFWINHTYEVERQISLFRIYEERAEAARRGYLLHADAYFIAAFDGAAGGIMPALAELRRLTADNPRQQANVAGAVAVATRHLAELRRSIALAAAGRRDDAAAAFDVAANRRTVRASRAIGERMMAEEDRLLALRDAAQQGGLRLLLLILSISGLLLVTVGTASIWVILRYTHDLAASRDALGALNANLEGAVRERTAELQRANDEIQRFAYIVSHDLRSPLVNVMGFTAELERATLSLARLVERVEQGAPDMLDVAAQDAVRSDLPEAIGFIRTSTQKMDRLINAILRLSREGRRPIAPERLDMTLILQGIIDSQRHRIDQLGIEMVIAPRLPEIVSDRLAIEQIFSNLVENAIKYLQPGRQGRIALSGRIETERAVFTVADNGRGIDARDHERIFDLFRRSGMQDQPGEGIGLAHTRALAYRLGGTITVDSRLGEGATFRVSLPRVFTVEQRAVT